MFRKKEPAIQVGDRFVKAGGSRKVWTVKTIAAAHARLVSREPAPDTITISVRALSDRQLFVPVGIETAEGGIG